MSNAFRFHLTADAIHMIAVDDDDHEIARVTRPNTVQGALATADALLDEGCLEDARFLYAYAGYPLEGGRDYADEAYEATGGHAATREAV